MSDHLSDYESIVRESRSTPSGTDQGEHLGRPLENIPPEPARSQTLKQRGRREERSGPASSAGCGWVSSRSRTSSRGTAGVTWMLTRVPAFLSAVLFTLFTAFDRPGIGAVVAAMLFLPIAAGAWARLFPARKQGEITILAELDEVSRSPGKRLQVQSRELNLGAGTLPP